METEKVATIIEKLTAKVDADEALDWKEIDTERFGLELGKIWVCFRRWQPEEPFEDESIYIEFWNNQRQEILESFSDNEMNSVLRDAYRKMRRLWKVGKMRATGFGGLLDDVIGNIDLL
ncbi:hypothetical protein NLY09_14180 (plasmid) [Burkholderia vietnamiensis]|jgi:hypothetical protein